MVARALAIVHTCIFDAWSAYDKKAVGTQLGGSLRRPKSEQTAANKSKATSLAAYRAAVDLFPTDKTTVFDPMLAALGYDPTDQSTDVKTSRLRCSVSGSMGTPRLGWWTEQLRSVQTVRVVPAPAP
jgi:hypothetical protein